jgi:hypothetical protein
MTRRARRAGKVALESTLRTLNELAANISTLSGGLTSAEIRVVRPASRWRVLSRRSASWHWHWRRRSAGSSPKQQLAVGGQIHESTRSGSRRLKRAGPALNVLKVAQDGGRLRRATVGEHIQGMTTCVRSCYGSGLSELQRLGSRRYSQSSSSLRRSCSASAFRSRPRFVMPSARA